MIRGIDLNQRVEFSCTNDTEDPKTVFVIRPLSGEEQENLRNPSTSKITLAGSRIYDFLELAIVDIKNLDVPGIDEKSTIRQKLQTITDSKILVELITACGSFNNVSKTDVKNS